MLRTYNLMVGFSKYEFYNKLLGDVTLLRVTLGITWTQLYIYILVQKEGNWQYLCGLQLGINRFNTRLLS